jgi:hypothetical protein
MGIQIQLPSFRSWGFLPLSLFILSLGCVSLTATYLMLAERYFPEADQDLPLPEGKRSLHEADPDAPFPDVPVLSLPGEGLSSAFDIDAFFAQGNNGGCFNLSFEDMLSRVETARVVTEIPQFFGPEAAAEREGVRTIPLPEYDFSLMPEVNPVPVIQRAGSWAL